LFLKEARPKRLKKPNPRYIYSTQDDSCKDVQPAKEIALRKNGKKPKLDSASSIGVTVKEGAQVKQITESKGVQRPIPKCKPVQSDKFAGKRQLCIKKKEQKKDKKNKDKKKKAVKFHFTIDCSYIDQMDLHGLGELVKTKMENFRNTKIKKKKLILTSETLFQKSSLKYWTKAYLKKHLKRSVQVVVTSKRSFQLKYSLLK